MGLKSRYSDASACARRSEPLSAAAEVQWDLLPPLSCSTEQVALSGILEPAYDIGGDSFDYAFDASRLDFAIVDVIGHGLSAVLMSAAAINSLRNSRRGRPALRLPMTKPTDRSQRNSVGPTSSLPSSAAWICRSGTSDVGERRTRRCRCWCETAPTPAPSSARRRGRLVSVVRSWRSAEAILQRGDRVLFYTDGITESRSSDGSFFGDNRLSDFLVRAALEDLPVQETVRHLSESVDRVQR